MSAGRTCRIYIQELMVIIGDRVKTDEEGLTNKDIGPTLSGNPVPAAPQDLKDKEAQVMEDLKDSVFAWSELVSSELKSRMEDPRKLKAFLKRMDPEELMAQVFKVMTALKKPNTVIMPKNFQVNMQQVNQYAKDIADNSSKRKQLRDQAREQLRNLPSRTSPTR